MKPKIRKDIYIREIKGEKVIYDKNEGKVHFLNRTATFIFELCDGSNNREDIINRLIDSYEVDQHTAEKDVEDVLKNFEENHMLEGIHA